MPHLTRASALAGFTEFACSQQLDPEALLNHVGLLSDAQDNPNNLISYDKFVHLLEHAAKVANNPLFGLQYGLFQGVDIFGTLRYLIRNARSVEQALHDLSHYFHMHNNSTEVLLQRRDGQTVLSYVSSIASHRGQLQIDELAMGVGQQLMQGLLGSQWQPQALLIKHAPLAPSSHYRQLLGICPQFNAPDNAWVFSDSLLAMPVPNADHALHEFMRKRLAQLSNRSEGGFAGQVQRLLRSFLPDGRVTLDYIAEVMHLSPRTLQRHLANEGTSFQKLLDQTRQHMVRHYLSEPDMSVCQLSELLGYADQSAFARAFQRWYGMSLTQWARQQEGSAN
ncbi:AraC family transcriptional regulator [Pseudomonas sp. UM16]|uniref:AraC family transcriptional regulator n=1 Tax=Pseudomonas sp. UM16 TaxID=3158962 RepID=UPI00398FC476